jgi:hypothetical protein
MIAINGIYKDGTIHLDRKINSKKSIKVVVTFLDESIQDEQERLSINNFSFHQSRQKTTNFKGNLSDAIIDDRKAE